MKIHKWKDIGKIDSLKLIEGLLNELIKKGIITSKEANRIIEEAKKQGR